MRCDVTVRHKVTRHVSVVFKHLFLSKIALQLKRKFCFRIRETLIRHTRRGQLSNHYSKEKSLRHVAMLANFLDLNKPWSNKYRRKKKRKKKMTCIPFLRIIALRNKTVAHTFLPSFENANGRLCQEPAILLT